MIRVENVNKVYSNGVVSCDVLHDVTLTFHDQEIVSITGASGAGKSTLLNLLALLDMPTSGEIFLNDKNLTKLSINERAAIRLNQFAFVFQNYQLISTLTAYENIVFPAYYKFGKIETEYCNQIIQQCGLENVLNHFPHEMSGGEQQRVAVCRALLEKPEVIFADEPTGNLDSKNAESVFELLIKCARETECALIYVTHEERFASLADSHIFVRDGICTKE